MHLVLLTLVGQIVDSKKMRWEGQGWGWGGFSADAMKNNIKLVIFVSRCNSQCSSDSVSYNRFQ